MKRLLILTATLIGNLAHADPITLYQGVQTCQSCKPSVVQQAANNVVNYAGNVSRAVVKPLENKPVRNFLARVRDKIRGCR